MAASETDIANSALVKIGVDTISALSDNTKAAKLCNARYAYTRDEILSQHPWNCAKKRASLALDGAAPAYYFTARFALPADFMKWFDSDMDLDDEWSLESGYILNFKSTLNITYIYKLTDTTKFDPLLTESIAWRLAADLAYPMVQSVTLAQQCWKAFGDTMALARSKNAQERGSIQQVGAYDWLQARLTSNGLGTSNDPSRL